MYFIGRNGLDDVRVDRLLSDEEVVAFLVRSLGVRPDEVYVIGVGVYVPEEPGPTRVICERSVRAGEAYPHLLSLWRTPGPTRPFHAIVAELCREFDCRCLVLDGSSEITTWLRFDGREIIPTGRDGRP